MGPGFGSCGDNACGAPDGWWLQPVFDRVTLFARLLRIQEPLGMLLFMGSGGAITNETRPLQAAETKVR